MEDDFDAAEAVTHEKVTKVTRSGAKKIKNVLVPLVPVLATQENEPGVSIPQSDCIDLGGAYENPDLERTSQRKKGKVKEIVIFKI